MEQLDARKIDETFTDLGQRLRTRNVGPYELVVCGGAALIACAMVERRTTRDVDVVALKDGRGLVSPDPFPADLKEEAERVGKVFDLADGWINNGPSRNPGGLFQVGLPEGLEEMESAARWSRTQDLSEGFAMILRSMLKQMGFDDVAERV